MKKGKIYIVLKTKEQLIEEGWVEKENSTGNKELWDGLYGGICINSSMIPYLGHKYEVKDKEDRKIAGYTFPRKSIKHYVGGEDLLEFIIFLLRREYESV